MPVRINVKIDLDFAKHIFDLDCGEVCCIKLITVHILTPILTNRILDKLKLTVTYMVLIISH